MIYDLGSARAYGHGHRHGQIMLRHGFRIGIKRNPDGVQWQPAIHQKIAWPDRFGDTIENLV